MIKSLEGTKILRTLEKPGYFIEPQIDRSCAYTTFPKKMTQILEYRLAKKTLTKLADRGNSGRLYTLRDKGNGIILRLKEIDSIATTNAKKVSRFEGLCQSSFEQVNLMDDIVRVQSRGRIAGVYVKEIQGHLKSRCRMLESENFVHMNFTMSLSLVRELV